MYGAGTVSEFDTQVAVEAALKSFTADKILLGVPSYGYSWETIDDFPRAGVVPSSVIIESNKDAQDFLSKNSTVSAAFDDTAKEKYVIYKTETGTYRQMFFPEKLGMQAKADFIKANNLGGFAIWALGYESETVDIYKPIQNFLKN